MEDDAFKTAVHHLMMTEEQGQNRCARVAVDVHQHARLLIERFSSEH